LVGLSFRQFDDLAPAVAPARYGHVRPFIHPLLAPELPIALAVQTDGRRSDTSYRCHLVGNRPEAALPLGFNCSKQLKGQERRRARDGSFWDGTISLSELRRMAHFPPRRHMAKLPTLRAVVLSDTRN